MVPGSMGCLYRAAETGGQGLCHRFFPGRCIWGAYCTEGEGGKTAADCARIRLYEDHKARGTRADADTFQCTYETEHVLKDKRQGKRYPIQRVQGVQSNYRNEEKRFGKNIKGYSDRARKDGASDTV